MPRPSLLRRAREDPRELAGPSLPRSRAGPPSGRTGAVSRRRPTESRKRGTAASARLRSPRRPAAAANWMGATPTSWPIAADGRVWTVHDLSGCRMPALSPERSIPRLLPEPERLEAAVISLGPQLEPNLHRADVARLLSRPPRTSGGRTCGRRGSSARRLPRILGDVERLFRRHDSFFERGRGEKHLHRRPGLERVRHGPVPPVPDDARRRRSG